jgi:hypothetical protein
MIQNLGVGNQCLQSNDFFYNLLFDVFHLRIIINTDIARHDTQIYDSRERSGISRLTRPLKEISQTRQKYNSMELHSFIVRHSGERQRVPGWFQVSTWNYRDRAFRPSFWQGNVTLRRRFVSHEQYLTT